MRRPSGKKRVSRTQPGGPPGRRPGRPAGTENSLLDRETILAVSFQLAKTVPLAELSIVRVARELGVTPGLVHYYLGGRDALTSGVMNAFYRELVRVWPSLGGDWRADMEAVAGTVYRAHIDYPGVASYVVSHNRFRLVQQVQKGETDYGFLFFERFTEVVRAAGFDARRTGIYAHLIIEFITAYAHATVAHRWPGEHSDFLNKRLAALDPRAYPAAHFVSGSFASLDAASAFSIGLGLFLHGLEYEREKVLNGRKPRRSRARSS